MNETSRSNFALGNIKAKTEAPTEVSTLVTYLLKYEKYAGFWISQKAKVTTPVAAKAFKNLGSLKIKKIGRSAK